MKCAQKQRHQRNNVNKSDFCSHFNFFYCLCGFFNLLIYKSNHEANSKLKYTYILNTFSFCLLNQLSSVSLTLKGTPFRPSRWQRNLDSEDEEEEENPEARVSRDQCGD